MADEGEGVPERRRLDELLSQIEQIAAGRHEPIPLSDRGDLVDALAFGVNVIVGELNWSHRLAREAEAQHAESLRRAKAQADAANQAKSTFLRNLSHELRTPLTGILLSSDLLETTPLPSKRGNELLLAIRNNCRSLLSLIQGVLDLSAIEEDRLTVQVERLQPDAVLASVLRGFEGQVKAKQILLESSMRTSAAPFATDPRYLRQILINLIGNAVKFTDRGQVRVSLERGADGELIVDVIDTGIGVAPEHRDRLFEKFSQADTSIGLRYGGTGLGLALSRRLAQALSGSVELVASTPGQGSTFRLTLKPLAAPAPPPEPPSVEHEVARLANLQLLVVEDNAEIREGLVAILESEGASVAAANDGQRAVEAGSARRFDIILMDVRMPRMDGLTATRTLRAQGYAGPIVALTANAISEDIASCREAGCDGYVAKPIEVDKLITEIQRFARG
jgi:signal transduction histidine kinase